MREWIVQLGFSLHKNVARIKCAFLVASFCLIIHCNLYAQDGAVSGSDPIGLDSGLPNGEGIDRAADEAFTPEVDGEPEVPARRRDAEALESAQVDLKPVDVSLVQPGGESGGMLTGGISGVLTDGGFGFGRLAWRFGDWIFGATVDVGSQYNDNLYGSNTNRIGDLSIFLSPRFFLGYGDLLNPEANRIRIYYAPKYNVYLEQTDLNFLDQTVLMDFQVQLARLEVSGGASFLRLDGIDAGRGGRLEQDISRANLQFAYDLNPKVQLRLVPDVSSTTYPTVEQTNTTAGVSVSLDYFIQPKFAVGAGIGARVMNFQGYGTVPGQSVFLNAGYDTLAKLRYTLKVGLQRQEAFKREGGRYTRLAPLINGSLDYAYSPMTSFTLFATSGVTNEGIVGDSTYVATDVGLNIRQSIGSRTKFKCSLLVSNDNYGNENPAYQGRNDLQVVFRPELEFTITQGYALSIYYQYWQDASNVEVYSFYQNIIGARLSISF